MSVTSPVPSKRRVLATITNTRITAQGRAARANVAALTPANAMPHARSATMPAITSMLGLAKARMVAMRSTASFTRASSAWSGPAPST